MPIKGSMEPEDAGVIKLYEPLPTPCLYVADVQNMMGRVPLMPLFLAGNLTPTILTYSARARIQAFRMAVPTRLKRTDCGAAMSMRSTRRCGSLGAVSPAWEA